MSFVYKKKLGQNFLKDNNIVKRIIDVADIDKNTLVIEIGPGSGAMSKLIASKAKYAILYEIDDRLKEVLENELSSFNNCKIIFNDFLKENVLEDIKKYDFKNLYIVANLPYYITTPIVEKFINDEILPDKLVLMMQKEVALRFSAKKNTREYGALTVLLNYYYDINKEFDVSRKVFVPEPNVDSAIVCMKKKENVAYVKDMKFFKKFVRDSFKYKRKNLRNNLRDYNLDKIDVVLNKYDLSLSDRAEALDLDVFIDVVNELV